MNKGRCRHTICQEAKSEVAREIFEEIDKVIKIINRVSCDGYEVDIVPFCLIVPSELDDLKKKYTESESNNGD